MRLDKALSRKIPDRPRTEIKSLIQAGQVKRCVPPPEAVISTPSHSVKAGETYGVNAPPLETGFDLEPIDYPLDILYEDQHLLVVNKPTGMTVHPGAGQEKDTLVHALLSHTDGNLSDIGPPERPGIVHRLDKDTTGALVVAKTNSAHKNLAAQIKAHTASRLYAAVVWGMPVDR